MDIDRSPSRGGSMGGMDATDDDKEDWGRLNDIIESIEYYHNSVKSGTGNECVIRSWLLLWSLYTAEQNRYQFSTTIRCTSLPPLSSSRNAAGWADIGQRLRWAYCHIPAYRTLLATLRWLRQVQANDLEDNKENTNGNGVLKAIFDILRTDGDDAAIRTLSQQASGDMYRALELAALMSSPSPTPYTHEDDDESLYYMDWTEKTMINTADGGDEEAYSRASNGIYPLPSRRLLVKEGILMQLSGSNTTSEGALSDDDRAWLGYLSGHLSTLLSTKDCWMGSEAPIRSTSLSPMMHAAATGGTSSSRGRTATSSSTVTWADGDNNKMMSKGGRDIGSSSSSPMSLLLPLQWAKLHCLKESATELILEGLFPSSTSRQQSSMVFGELEYLRGWWNALLRAYDNNDNSKVIEIENRLNTAIQQSLLQAIHTSTTTPRRRLYENVQISWITAMCTYHPTNASSSSSPAFMNAMCKPLKLIWDWLNNDDDREDDDESSNQALYTSSEFGGYLATLYRQELLPYHHQELTSNVVDALFDGLIRAKLEVEDDMKYDATASTIMGDHILDEHTLTVFKDRVINASSHIEIIKGTSAQVEAWVWFIRKSLITEGCYCFSSSSNPMSPHLLQSLFTIFSSLSSIIADEVVSKFDTRIQVLREVVAVCAETSSEEETLKRHVGGSIQLDTGVSSSQSTPVQLVAAISLVRAWWLAYYDGYQQQQQQQQQEDSVMDIDMITALCACLVYPLLELFILDQKVSSDILTLHLQNNATPHFWTAMANAQREVASLREGISGKGRRRNSITDADLDDMLSVYESLDSIVWLQSLVQDAILHQRHAQILDEAPLPATEESLLSYNNKEGGGAGSTLPLEVRRRMADARRQYERLQTCEEESRNKIIQSLRTRVMEYDVFLPTLRKSQQGRLQLAYCAWMAIQIGLSVHEDIRKELLDVWLPQSLWLQSSLPSSIITQLRSG